MSKDNVPPESDSKVKELFKIRDPGARKLDSTSLFRTVNFELYARPVSKSSILMEISNPFHISSHGLQVYHQLIALTMFMIYLTPN